MVHSTVIRHTEKGKRLKGIKKGKGRGVWCTAQSSDTEKGKD